MSEILVSTFSLREAMSTLETALRGGKRGRYLAGKTDAAKRPWLAQGISERTYYGRMAREKV